MGHYLGLDSSTQSLSAVVIDTDTGKLVYETSILFGEDLPEFACPQGFLPNPDPLVRHADPLLWVAALDRILARMRADGVDFSRIDAVSGSGQQHGTVYLSADFEHAYNPAHAAGLVAAVGPFLTRRTSPIWMDSSTSSQCREINAALGGESQVRARSGSSAIERFSGPQIRKFYQQEPEAYAATGRIHLVSSFLCALLTGGSAPIDFGDGAGMNLLNLATGDWDNELLEATAPGLRDKLPRPMPSTSTAGTIHPCFQKTHGFRSNVPVVAWSGDNPNSLIGVGGWRPGTVVISLGTSDTLFAAMQCPVVDPDGYGHVFGNPAGGFMCLICFKNGSLARERVKESYGLSWPQFDVDAFAHTPCGNNSNMMLPYFVPEITPLVLGATPVYHGSRAFIEGNEAYSAVRALVEAQALSMRAHSQWIGEKPRVVRVTGGASRSQGICQVLADVFNARVERLETANSAALGAALRAAAGVGEDWQRLTETFCAAVPGRSVEPLPENVAVYRNMLPEFIAFEKIRA